MLEQLDTYRLKKKKKSDTCIVVTSQTTIIQPTNTAETCTWSPPKVALQQAGEAGQGRRDGAAVAVWCPPRPQLTQWKEGVRLHLSTTAGGRSNILA